MVKQSFILIGALLIVGTTALAETTQLKSEAVQDNEPPRVTITVSNPLLHEDLTRVGDPIAISVKTTSHHLIEDITVEMNRGEGYVPLAPSKEGTYEYTPMLNELFTLRAVATDSKGNKGSADIRLRAVNTLKDGKLIPGPLLGPPVKMYQHTSYEGIGIQFSEPLDPDSINETTVQLIDPDGNSVAVKFYLEDYDTTLWIIPHRLLRMGAKYKVKYGAEMHDASGERFEDK